MLRLFVISIGLIFPAILLAQDSDSDVAGLESVDDAGLLSADAAGTESVDGTGTESVDGTGSRSADGTGIQSVDGTGIQSVSGTGIQSVDGTGIQSLSGTASEAASASQTYVIETGDTLRSIAQQFYGDADMWQTIFDANSSVISDSDNIPAGTTITIPGN